MKKRDLDRDLHRDYPKTYDEHRTNARRMSDETLLYNMPLASVASSKSSWAKAMRDEADARGLKYDQEGE